jgi:hypothetical protein
MCVSRLLLGVSEGEFRPLQWACGSVNHQQIDNCLVVHSIMSDYLDFIAHCEELDTNYCDDGNDCN